MEFLYSPLEQFEPIPFITIYLSNINFSITSISIMCIYLIFILVFFLNGYILEPSTSGSLNISKEKDGSFMLKTNNTDAISPNTSVLSSSLNKEISYFSFLANRSNSFSFLMAEKASWVSAPLTFSSVSNRYSSIFYKGFYNLLNSKSSSLSNSHIETLKSVSSDFCVGYTGNSASLNNNFDVIKGQQSFYSFSTNSIKNTYQNTFVPKVNLFFFEAIYTVILDMVKNTIGTDRQSVSFFPVIFTLFSFILISNVSGLVPYGSTITAYLIITITMSTMVMVAVTIYAFKGHGIHFFGHFLPGGTPGWLIPFIIPIEILSFVFRVVSLAVRLFANMMAGHTLLAVLAGFGWTMATGSVMIALVSPAPVFVVFVLVGLETAVAMIQAYVFTILTCIYFEEAINMH
jgi:ATP synthase subunit 6